MPMRSVDPERKALLLNHAISYFFSNLDDANEALNTDYTEEEVSELHVEIDASLRESAAASAEINTARTEIEAARALAEKTLNE